MPAVVKIDSVEVVQEQGSIQIREALEERTAANFVVVDNTSAATYVRGTPVTIDDIQGNSIFAGFIATPSRRRVGFEDNMLHSISCMDNRYLADKRTIARIWTDVTAGSIVTDIITDYLAAEGITAGTITAGPIIKLFKANYANIAQALDALKEQTGMIWKISDTKVLDFIERSSNAAPWSLTAADIIPGTAELATGNSDYRNRQWVRGGLVPTSAQTEAFVADGEQVAFACGYPLYSVPVVTEDAGAPKTIGIKGLDIGKQYYWNKGDEVVTAAVAPAAAVIVRVVYVGLFRAISFATNNAEIIARAAIEGGTGFVDASLYDVNLETKDAEQEMATSKLIEYCRDAEQFYFSTNRYGLRAGQLLPVTYSPFGFVAHEMLIKSVTISFVLDQALYEVQAVTGPLLGSWTKLFESLFTQASGLVSIGEGDVVIILLYQEENLALTEETDLDTDDFTGGIVGRWIALPPETSEGHHVQHELLSLIETPTDTETVTEDYDWG